MVDSLLSVGPTHRRNITVGDIGRDAVVQLARVIDYVRYRSCCRRFRRGAIG